MSDFTFSSEGVERPVEFTLIPVGDQVMMVEKTEWVDGYQAQVGDPKELKLQFTVLEGEFKNRKLWKKLKINSVDPTELKKAKGQFASLLDAIGITTIGNTAELCNKPLTVKVGVFTPDGKEPINIIQAFKKYGNVAAPVVAPVASSKKPWE